MRQGGHEPVGLGGPQRGPHLLVGDVRAEGDVAADGVVEEERGLRNQGDVAGQLAGGEVAQVRPVDEDRPASRVDQPGQQGGQGALARCGRPDHGDGAAGLDHEVRSLEQALAGVVGEAEVVDDEPARAASEAASRASPYVVSLTVSRTR